MRQARYPHQVGGSPQRGAIFSLFLRHNEIVGCPLGGRKPLNPAKSRKIVLCLLLRRGTLPHQRYRFNRLGFSVRGKIKRSKPQPLGTTDFRMLLARTETNLPTKNIPLIVREDAFSHELHLRRRNRCLDGDNDTDT